MGVRVLIEFQGLQTVLGNLDSIGEKAEKNLEAQVKQLAKDTEEAWIQATPRRTGRLQGADKAKPAGLEFTLQNDVYYYKFVDEGHDTPRGWHTKHGYRLAKHRSHVEGRNITEKAIQFITANILDYLAKFLD